MECSSGFPTCAPTTIRYPFNTSSHLPRSPPFSTHRNTECPTGFPLVIQPQSGLSVPWIPWWHGKRRTEKCEYLAYSILRIYGNTPPQFTMYWQRNMWIVEPMLKNLNPGIVCIVRPYRSMYSCCRGSKRGSERRWNKLIQIVVSPGIWSNDTVVYGWECWWDVTRLVVIRPSWSTFLWYCDVSKKTSVDFFVTLSTNYLSYLSSVH